MEAFAWPLSICGMVVIIVGILALRFPSQLGGLISRITRIGASGVHANPAPPVVTQAVKEIVKAEAAEEQLRVFDNQLLVWHENNIKETLLKAVDAPADRERILVRHLAWLNLQVSFEGVYNTIWGSQISALQVVNQSGAAGAPPEMLRMWYEFGEASTPARYTDYGFEKWLGFMQGMYLVETGADGNTRITTYGNEFLMYMIRNRYSFYKEG